LASFCGAANNKVFEAGVSSTRYLPPPMYGQWSVTATLLEGNSSMFSPVVHDIWRLERVGDFVMISNPATGASATVTVDQVNGNTATFHREVHAKNGSILVETPTVTVNGTKLTGFTQIQMKHDARVKLFSSEFTGKYQLEAEKMGGSRVRFGQDTPDPELEFEIADPVNARMPSQVNRLSEPNSWTMQRSVKK
jgi:hypothetical protein